MPPSPPASWLIWNGGDALAKPIAEQLRIAGHTVTLVSESLALDELRSSDSLPSCVLFLPGTVEEEGAEGAGRALHQVLYPLVEITKTYGERATPASIVIATPAFNRIRGDEESQPIYATLIGPCLAIPQEYPLIRCRLVDHGGSTDAKVLMKECCAEESEPLIAYRGRQRWMRSFTSLALDEPEVPSEFLRDRGVYLITGGRGGIGLAMASHLARTVQARLILIGRTPLPERSAWNHHLSTDSRHARTIGAILEMERNGAEVLNVAADVADARAMRSAIQAAFSRFGLVDGVIHAAGVTASERIPFKTAATMHSVLAPKVVGTMVLEEILRDQPLDFFLLMSSLSSITGTGPGQLDYCSGNAFLDAFARAEAKANRRIVAVNWCEWQWDASEGKMSEYSSDLHRMMRQYRDKMGITFEEGMNAWVRILASGFDQVAVSTQPLEKIQESRLSFNATRLGDAAAEEAISQYQHPRPELEVAFEAPGNEIETKLTEIWEELLHLGPVGIHDDFFDLGGHSLLATQLFSRISRTLEVDLSVSDIFDVPTVALQAEMISAVLWSRPQQASISTAAGVVAGEI